MAARYDARCMNPTFLSIAGGVFFGLWTLVMSLTGLRAGGVAFVLVAGTLLVITPYFLSCAPRRGWRPGTTRHWRSSRASAPPPSTA